jgi:hypothetical protein
MLRHVEGERRRSRWYWVAGTPVIVKERRVRGRDHQRNIDLAFKKSGLRTLTKLSTNVRKTTTKVKEEEIGAVEKPKY